MAVEGFHAAATSPAAEAIISAVIVSLIGPAILKWLGARLQRRHDHAERRLSMEQQFREAEFARAERIQNSREQEYQRLCTRVDELEAENDELQKEVRRLKPYEERAAALERESKPSSAPGTP